jgi:D-lactate dehydrogenase (cytochrome)
LQKDCLTSGWFQGAGNWYHGNNFYGEMVMAEKNASIITDVEQAYPDCLRDESRRTGHADGIAFPVSATDVCDVLKYADGKGMAVTVQGARTGVAGGAVPDGGLVLSLERMDRILGVRFDDAGQALIRVQPGLKLSALRNALEGGAVDQSDWSDTSRETLTCLLGERWMFTPDPTEASATLGGMVACNASGACSFAYGATREHVQSLVVALADGDVIELERHVAFARGLHFELTTRGGRKLAGELPKYAMPDVKNASGYHVQPDMDLMDLFIGSEGTLGVIVEMELILHPRPPVTWGVMCFLGDEVHALDLVEWSRNSAQHGTARPVAVEYFDHNVLEMLRQARQAGTRLPVLKPAWRQAVYIEYSAATEEKAAALGTAVAHWLSARSISADDSWVAAREDDLARLKAFRHAAPEQVNLRIAERQRIHPGLTKLGTDLAVPDAYLRSIMAMYRHDLAEARLEYVIFGHIGNNHLHVNILPRDADEYEKGRALYEAWARQVVAWGGSVSAEHGVGKLKTSLLLVMYGLDGVAQMRAVKKVFDPDGRLNPGDLFEMKTTLPAAS